MQLGYRRPGERVVEDGGRFSVHPLSGDERTDLFHIDSSASELRHVLVRIDVGLDNEWPRKFRRLFDGAVQFLLRLHPYPVAAHRTRELDEIGVLDAGGDARVVVGHLLELDSVQAAVDEDDDIEDGRFSAPSLTTVAPDKVQTAELSVGLLARRLRRYPPPPPPEEITVGYTVVIRESSARPAG